MNHTCGIDDLHAILLNAGTGRIVPLAARFVCPIEPEYIEPTHRFVQSVTPAAPDDPGGKAQYAYDVLNRLLQLKAKIESLAEKHNAKTIIFKQPVTLEDNMITCEYAVE